MPIKWPMSSLNREIRDMRKTTCYDFDDLPSSFWQLALDEAFKFIHAFVTDISVFVPIRTLQVGRNCAQKFQAKVALCFEEMSDYLNVWIDNMAINSRTERERELMTSLHTFACICKVRSFRDSAKKTNLFRTKIKWCGRVIRLEDVWLHSRDDASVKTCAALTRAGKLRKYVHWISWI